MRRLYSKKSQYIKKKTFPRWSSDSTEDIFHAEMQTLKSGDVVIAVVDGKINTGKIIITSKIIRSDINIKVWKGKRYSREKDQISINNIIAFTRTLTAAQLEERCPEFFI